MFAIAPTDTEWFRHICTATRQHRNRVSEAKVDSRP